METSIRSNRFFPAIQPILTITGQPRTSTATFTSTASSDTLKTVEAIRTSLGTLIIRRGSLIEMLKTKNVPEISVI